MFREDFAATPVSTLEAQILSRDLYGLEVAATKLPGEYDDNFHLWSADSREFVLKVMHPSRDEGFVDMQCQALRWLAERAPQVALPRVVATTSGCSFLKTPRSDGTASLVWMLTYVPGKVLAEVRPHSAELLSGLGRMLGEIDSALQGFFHPAAQRDLKWDSSKALWIREELRFVDAGEKRELVKKVLEIYECQALPKLSGLRRSVIYGDANDYNVLVGESGGSLQLATTSVIDFGDMHYGTTVSELAIAAAYASLHKSDPLPVIAALVRGYHHALPLSEEELTVLFSLILARLAVSVTNSAKRKVEQPNDPYVTVSEAGAWEALAVLAKIHSRFAFYTLRAACGIEEFPAAEKLRRYLGGVAAASVIGGLGNAKAVVFDLSVGSALLGADPGNCEVEGLGKILSAEMQRCGAAIGVGRYNEARSLYTSALFGATENPIAERRTIHLGVDLFVEPGTAIYAPLDGVVNTLANNQNSLDYGPLVILRHSADENAGSAAEFFTLYGHLSEATLGRLKIGQQIARGEVFASVGDEREDGSWPPHLHFQVIGDLLDQGAEFPGVALASQRDLCISLCPDPNLLLKLPQEIFPVQPPDAAETLAKRREMIGGNVRLSYRKPLKIVRGWKQHLYDETGRAFLDAYNNVPLVGHNHPQVVEAVQKQMALLNTNTRYLHDNINRYADRLTKLLPAPLRVCYFVNSGSEANELALRLARAHTGAEDVVVLENAYHGHTSTLVDVSPYKFDGPGGRGKKEWVHVATLPDDYRGTYRRSDPQAGKKYAQHVAEITQAATRSGRKIAAFLAETMPSVAGQIVFPPNYLSEAYAHVRAAGGVCVADEVQTGFGRLGTHFWGFETQDAVPDVVVLGKPIGNGFPLGAVITTEEIARSFDNGMEFFSTFGGTPVACAAGLAVLDVVESEKLQENARQVGGRLKLGLERLQAKFAIIGDVRGAGLFLGVELVDNRQSLLPATAQAAYIVERMRELGVLVGTDGPYHNVIKLRPPLIFADDDSEVLLRVLEEILGEDQAQPRHLRETQ